MDYNANGAIPSPIDIRDYRINKTACASINFPQTFITDRLPVKNQRKSPTCVAHALAEVVEYHNRKQNEKFTTFSTEFIYGCRFDDDYMGEGMVLRDALKELQKYGDVFYTVLPQNSDNVEDAMKNVLTNFDTLKPQAYPNRISTYYRIKNINELKYALIHDGPVAVCAWWYGTTKLDKDKVLTYTETEDKGGHAFLIVGYDEEYLIAQNSWGTSWGDKGFFKIRISDFEKLFFDVFGVTDNINNEDIVQPNKFGIIAVIINAIIKIFSKRVDK